MDKLEYIHGDLVYFEGEKAKVDLYNPNADDSIWVKVIENGGENRIWNASLKEEISPIPLTQEILEKNGWKKDKDGYLNDSYHIRLCENNTNYAAYKVVNDSIVWLRAVKNVPDLQHLLFGLDISLKIEV